jgi:hypothetical protein
MRECQDPYDLSGGRFSNKKVPRWPYHNPAILQYVHGMQDDSFLEILDISLMNQAMAVENCG